LQQKLIVELKTKRYDCKEIVFYGLSSGWPKYHDADEVWDDLKVGTILKLERDKENRFDPYAVMVVFKKKDDEYLLGYIPRGENETISNFIEMGWGNIFECRINKIDPEVHPERQIELVVKILKNNNKKDE
jgi:hypothetical protein